MSKDPLIDHKLVPMNAIGSNNPEEIEARPRVDSITQGDD